MVEPHFKMLWSEHIPRYAVSGDGGTSTEIACIAGSIGNVSAPLPPPNSWAAQPDADLAIMTFKMSPGAKWILPAAATAKANRRLYFFHGSPLSVAGTDVPVGTMIELRSDANVELINGDATAEILMLQGKPIDEPVAQYGPFVMNTEAEVQQAFQDYRKTQFGGWPWQQSDPVHAREQGRFAKHADGEVETRE